MRRPLKPGFAVSLNPCLKRKSTVKTSVEKIVTSWYYNAIVSPFIKEITNDQEKYNFFGEITKLIFLGIVFFPTVGDGV